MPLPSIIKSFFPESSSITKYRETFQRTERIVNITYLVLLSLAAVSTISGIFLSLAFPLLGTSICLISLAIGSCLLLLFPILPDIAKSIAQQKAPSVVKKTKTSLRSFTKYLKLINFNKISH
ncbi:hypothetical protein [Chlamydia sp.]|uniref:hypothetical protein n=1 Tax=Chlamydia sp. TaxID=35827 RepID=UPI00343AB498|nr:hypothetical protein [Chlamydia sp.]